MLFFVLKVTIYAFIIVCALYGFSKVKDNLLKQNNSETFVDDDDDTSTVKKMPSFLTKKEPTLYASDKTKVVLDAIKNKLLQLQDEVSSRASSINVLLEQFELDTLYDYEQADVPQVVNEDDDVDDDSEVPPVKNEKKNDKVEHDAKKDTKKKTQQAGASKKNTQSKKISKIKSNETTKHDKDLSRGVIGTPSLLNEWSNITEFDNENDFANDADTDDDDDNSDADGNDDIDLQREEFNTLTGITSNSCASCSFI